jgi:cobalt-zinc-cadmium efflux system protein
VGLAANLAVARYLQAQHGHNLNMRAAIAHVLGDALASAAVIVGAIAIVLGGPTQIDPILSVLIGVIIVVSGWGIFRESLNILMEGAPPGVDVDQLVADLRAEPGVAAVHDIHVWRLASDIAALSVHVRLADAAPADGDHVLSGCHRLLRERYGIEHSTIQIERASTPGPCAPAPDGPDSGAYCAVPRRTGDAGTRPASDEQETPEAAARNGTEHSRPGAHHRH